MYVSPFIAADAEYELLVWEDDERLAITIRENEGDEPVLVARLQVRQVPLTNGNLMRLLAGDPLVPLKTSALIFWHAIRLWWRAGCRGIATGVSNACSRVLRRLRVPASLAG